MLHGLDDDYVVWERHALYVWENAIAPKENLWVEGATHSDLPEFLGTEYNLEIISFINEYVNN